MELAFVHIPKTGGTSIENAALKQNIKWGRFVNWKIHNTDNTLFKFKNPGQKCHMPPCTLPSYYSDKRLFCVVRNPYTKIISEFKWFLINRPLTKNNIKAVKANCKAKI